MLLWIDKQLNKITMYRLTLYGLLALIIAAGLMAQFSDQFSFGFLPLAYSMFFLIAVCFVANTIFGKIFRVPPNTESVYITAFILTLILNPATDSSGFVFLFWAGLIAMASKYILAINRKHIFNPAAAASVITYFVIGQSASWWIGNMYLLPFVLIVGFLVVRKLQRFSLPLIFLATTTILTLGFAYAQGTDLVLLLRALYLNSALLFFASIMLTEPLTAPYTKKWQIVYGALVGILFSPFVHLGTFYFTPEMALVVGNVFAYAVNPKYRLVLKLLERKQIGSNLYDFVFALEKPLKFRPGQYMEWTLPHQKSDQRGNRRYFTLASSPTEQEVRLGVKFYEPSSTYKQALLSMNPGDKIFAGQLTGEFVLPNNPQQKLVLIAGGIGITPFRSMIKYLVDQGEKREVVLFYSNKRENEVAYREVFDSAKNFGLKTIYILTDQVSVPSGWAGERGRINAQMIQKHVPNFREYTFFVSGKQQMVVGTKDLLVSMNIPKNQIVTDFFPGFA